MPEFRDGAYSTDGNGSGSSSTCIGDLRHVDRTDRAVVSRLLSASGLIDEGVDRVGLHVIAHLEVVASRTGYAPDTSDGVEFDFVHQSSESHDRPALAAGCDW